MTRHAVGLTGHGAWNGVKQSVDSLFVSPLDSSLPHEREEVSAIWGCLRSPSSPTAKLLRDWYRLSTCLEWVPDIRPAHTGAFHVPGAYCAQRL